MSTMFMPLRRYADFNGRSRRKEFWLWTLFNTIVVGVLVGVMMAMLFSAMWRVGERGGIQRIDSINSFSTPRGVEPTVPPSTLDPTTIPEAPVTNSLEIEPPLNSAEELENLDVPEEGMNFYSYSTGYSYQAEYYVDPAMLFRELGAGFWIVFALMMLWLLATFIPTLAVSIRRLHDQDKSGWFYLLNFVPFVGPIILFVFYLLEGTRGPNQYGPDPKQPYDPGAFA